MNPTQLLLRAAGPDDLDAYERLAVASATGITTLPADRARLLQRLQRAAQAFASGDDSSGEEIYLFVLEDHGAAPEGGRPRVVGTSGIAASAGFADRFYSFRNEMVVHASAALGASNRIHTLHLCHDLTGHTLLSSFYIAPAYEDTLAPQLLSRARLLFIQAFAERFSDRIAAENPGLADTSGRCPFWDAVGRRFFDMDYPQVEQLTGGRSKAFIAELMPHSPIYVPLLPEQAQWAIGQLHPVSELPWSILLDEGFDAETYVDIFDGGPTVDARVAMLKTVTRAHARHWVRQPPRLAAAAGTDEPPWHLVASPRRRDFAAVLRRVPPGDTPVALDDQARAWLGVAPGEPVRLAALDTPSAGPTHGAAGAAGTGARP
jgi:arginine N-succinyltransferase